MQGCSVGDVRNMVRTVLSLSPLVDGISILKRLRKSCQHIEERSIFKDVMYEQFSDTPNLIGQQYEAHLEHLSQGLLAPFLLRRNKGFSGIIIQGPTGVGKTTLARKLAHDCRKYYKVLSVSGSDLVHKVVGDSEKCISELFVAARKVSPVIILMENIDILLGNKTDRPSAIANTNTLNLHSRTNDRSLDRLLSAFLVEIDGIASASRVHELGASISLQTGAVIVVATTYDIASLDRSLLRPGRLEEHVYLELPSRDDRRLLIFFFLKHIEIKNVTKHSEEFRVLVAKLVDLTEHRSVSEIKKIIDNLTFSVIKSAIADNTGNVMSEIPELTILSMFSENEPAA